MGFPGRLKPGGETCQGRLCSHGYSPVNIRLPRRFGDLHDHGGKADVSAISAGVTAGFIGAAARPLPPSDDAGFAAAFDPWARRRVLMLGESSHGTNDFYRARAAITRHMIQHHGVTIVAVEADWPDAAVLNRHVRGLPQGDAPLPFRRFPR